jgi:hypothetical protein
VPVIPRHNLDLLQKHFRQLHRTWTSMDALSSCTMPDGESLVHNSLNPCLYFVSSAFVSVGASSDQALRWHSRYPKGEGLPRSPWQIPRACEAGGAAGPAWRQDVPDLRVVLVKLVLKLFEKGAAYSVGHDGLQSHRGHHSCP